MRKCKDLIRELDNYKFKTDESVNSGFTGKPVDKDNHGINALEWIAMELPSNPADLLYGVYNKKGINIAEEKEEEEKKLAYWALSDEEERLSDLMSETPYDIAYNMW